MKHAGSKHAGSKHAGSKHAGCGVLEHRGPRGGVALVEDRLHQQLRLPHRQPAAHHHDARRGLVATWQPTHRHRRTWRDQAEAHVCLHLGVERFHQHQPAPYPAFVALKKTRDLRLSESIFPME